MGLRNFIDKVLALTRYDQLRKQLAENRAKGLDETECNALLVLQRWDLPTSPDMAARAVALAMGLGESERVIGLLIFSQRLGLRRAMRSAFAFDPFFSRHGCLYATAVPLTEFARKYMIRLWDQKPVTPGIVQDVAFAAYYATLIAPFALDAWLMLAQLRQWGTTLEIDGRNHAEEGMANGRAFLDSNPDADPEFLELLRAGIDQLAHAGKG
jgi:hypothetical protein